MCRVFSRRAGLLKHLVRHEHDNMRRARRHEDRQPSHQTNFGFCSGCRASSKMDRLKKRAPYNRCAFYFIQHVNSVEVQQRGATTHSNLLSAAFGASRRGWSIPWLVRGCFAQFRGCFCYSHPDAQDQTSRANIHLSDSDR